MGVNYIHNVILFPQARFFKEQDIDGRFIIFAHKRPNMLTFLS